MLEKVRTSEIRGVPYYTQDLNWEPFCNERFKQIKAMKLACTLQSKKSYLSTASLQQVDILVGKLTPNLQLIGNIAI